MSFFVPSEITNFVQKIMSKFRPKLWISFFVQYAKFFAILLVFIQKSVCFGQSVIFVHQKSPILSEKNICPNFVPIVHFFFCQNAKFFDLVRFHLEQICCVPGGVWVYSAFVSGNCRARLFEVLLVVDWQLVLWVQQRGTCLQSTGLSYL